MALQDDIRHILNETETTRIYSDSPESITYAHMAVERLTRAVLRLAREVEESRGHAARDENGRRVGPFK